MHQLFCQAIHPNRSIAFEEEIIVFHFTANLKPYNVFRGKGNRRFDSYLLSVDYFDEHKDLARLVVQENRTLCADNGNVDLITEFIGLHADNVKPLQESRKTEEEKLEGKARPGQLSPSLTDGFQQFAQDIFLRAKEVISDEHVVSVLRTQESMTPTYIVGILNMLSELKNTNSDHARASSSPDSMRLIMTRQNKQADWLARPNWMELPQDWLGQ